MGLTVTLCTVRNLTDKQEQTGMIPVLMIQDMKRRMGPIEKMNRMRTRVTKDPVSTEMVWPYNRWL